LDVFFPKYRLCFVRNDRDETKRRRNETISVFSRRQPETSAGYISTNEHAGPKTARDCQKQGTVMIKAISAIAIAALAASTLTVLPGFAPQVEASVPQALAKADRLDIHAVGRGCSEQAWPNFEATCLRSAGTKAVVRQARLVTADRMP
jgi:hypothetical protein